MVFKLGNKIKQKHIITGIIIFLIILFLLACAIYFLIQAIEYKKYTKEAFDSVQACRKFDNTTYVNDEHLEYGDLDCFKKMYHLTLPNLLIYKAKRENKFIDDIYRIDYMYAISDQLMKESDAVMSYGIGWAIGFDAYISKNYEIPIYLFDCGCSDKKIAELNEKFKNMHAQNECIGSDKYLTHYQKSSHKIHTFGQKLKELNLQDKKVFLKLGIPEMFEYTDDILKYKDNIVAISLADSFFSSRHIIDYNEFFERLNEDFILISRNIIYLANSVTVVYPVIKYVEGEKPFEFSLLYVNKKYIDKYYLPWNQDNLKTGYAKDTPESDSGEFYRMAIDPIVVFFEKMKILKTRLSK